VGEILQMREAGWPLAEIADTLNTQGIGW